MLLIGFSWIIIACLAGAVVTKVLPGKWEDHGPAAIMLAGVGSTFAGMLAILATDGISGYGPSTAGATTGLIFSAIGGLVGFMAYVMDVKRRAQA